MAEIWWMRTSWSAEDERDFARRIARTRSMRGMYLTLQAGTLLDTARARADPALVEPALRLLDRFFAECPADDSHRPIAHQRRAQALLALGRTEEGLAENRAAMEAEAVCRVSSYSWIEFAWNAVRHGPPALHDEVLALLEEHRSSVDLFLPENAYRVFGALAWIAGARGEHENARACARRALEAAARSTGPFAQHPGAGLVEERDPLVDARLRRLAAEPVP